uniref:Uncharacterized protein n=1 Tax=Anguilla anguilla TaxID=7936 RepID=A0A0E9ULY5_ANGAN
MLTCILVLVDLKRKIMGKDEKSKTKSYHSIASFIKKTGIFHNVFLCYMLTQTQITAKF